MASELSVSPLAAWARASRLHSLHTCSCRHFHNGNSLCWFELPFDWAASAETSTATLLLQVVTEGWHYTNSLNAMRKSGRPTYGTQEVWLLERIKAVQEDVGADVDYQDWENIPLMEEPLPAFGLERPLPMQPVPSSGAGSDAGAYKFLPWLLLRMNSKLCGSATWEGPCNEC